MTPYGILMTTSAISNGPSKGNPSVVIDDHDKSYKIKKYSCFQTTLFYFYMYYVGDKNI